MGQDGLTQEQAKRLLALMDRPEVEALQPSEALSLVLMMLLREWLKDIAKGE